MREYYEKEWFPKAFAIGISWHDFWGMNPHIIKLHMDGVALKQRKEDEAAWWQGLYNHEAFMVALAHFGAGLGGKKSTVKYLEKPFMAEYEEKKKEEELTEEQIIKRTENLFAMLEIQAFNHKMANKDKGQ